MTNLINRTKTTLTIAAFTVAPVAFVLIEAAGRRSP